MAAQSILYYSLLLFLMLIGYIFPSKQSSVSSKELNADNNFFRFKILFPVLVFSVFFGMRYDVGVDHLTYLRVYINRHEGSSFELLFNLINQFCYFFNFHFAIYFSILAFLQIFFYYYAFRSELYLIPFLTFFLITDAFFLFWMNGIRQGIAMTIWVFSLYFIIKKEPWKYIVTVIFASLFHASAIILLAIYPLFTNSRLSIKNIFIQLLLFFLTLSLREYLYTLLMSLDNLLIFLISISSSKYLYYMDNINEVVTFGGADSLSFIWRKFLMVIIILYSKKLRAYYNNKFFDLIYVLFLYSLLLGNITPLDSILRRVTIYFEIFRPIMLSYFSYYLLKNKFVYNKILFTIVIFGYIGLFILRQLVADEESSSLFQFYFLQ